MHSILSRGRVAAPLALLAFTGGLALANPPPEPGEPYAVRYSGTAGGVAWDPEGVRRFEVARDGIVVAVSDARSYVDDSLSGGTAYEYRIVSIDDEGERSAPVTVTMPIEGVDETPVASDVPPLDEVSNDLIASAAFYPSAGLAARVSRLAVRAMTTNTAARQLPNAELALELPDDRRIRLPSTVLEYGCDLGGRATIQRVVSDGTDTRTDLGFYRFEDCRLGADDDDGEEVVDGDLFAGSHRVSGPDDDLFSRRNVWSGFTYVDESGAGFEVDGSVDASTTADGTVGTESREVALSRYSRNDDAGAAERLEDIDFDFSTKRLDGRFDAYSLVVSGTVTNARGGDVGVAIDTVIPFRRGPGTTGPLVGELALRAEDGRFLSITARPTDAFVPLLVDRDFVDSDGTVRRSEGVGFVLLGAFPSVEAR